LTYIPKALKDLIEILSSLPGIGPKSARRISFFLIQKQISFTERLSENLIKAKKEIRFCNICGGLSEDEICFICSDQTRDRTTLCIIETFIDQIVLENVNYYFGLYHILGGTLSPLDGRGPKDLSIGKLITRLKKDNFKEVIIATNPTPEGNTTALYISELLENMDIKLSRIGRGVPVGSDIDLLDSETIRLALAGRMRIEKEVD